MYCQNCGKEMSEGTRFCADCGTPVVQHNRNKKLLIVIAVAVSAVLAVVFIGLIISGLSGFGGEKFKTPEELAEKLTISYYTGDFEGFAVCFNEEAVMMFADAFDEPVESLDDYFEKGGLTDLNNNNYNCVVQEIRKEELAKFFQKHYPHFGSMYVSMLNSIENMEEYYVVELDVLLDGWETTAYVTCAKYDGGWYALGCDMNY